MCVSGAVADGAKQSWMTSEFCKVLTLDRMSIYCMHLFVWTNLLEFIEGAVENYYDLMGISDHASRY
jgi:hypothetical protein